MKVAGYAFAVALEDGEKRYRACWESTHEEKLGLGG